MNHSMLMLENVGTGIPARTAVTTTSERYLGKFSNMKYLSMPEFFIGDARSGHIMSFVRIVRPNGHPAEDFRDFIMSFSESRRALSISRI